MANDERNFRSSYYEKVGCRSVEEKKSLEILLKEKPCDKVKLKQFILRFTVPSTHRNLLWKIQLGVLPVYTDSHEFVASQRQEQFNDLLNALKLMRIVDDDTPKPHLFQAMYFLETGKLHYDFNLQMESGIVAISKTLLQMYNDVDAYWLAKGFHYLVEQFKKDIPRLIESFKTILEREDLEVYRFLIAKCSLNNLPLEKWFSCCFAGIIDELALVKIWDKICGGSSNILVFVAVALIGTLRRNVLRCHTNEDILKCLQDIPEEAEEVITNRALELWQPTSNMVPTLNDLSLSKSKPDLHLR